MLAELHEVLLDVFLETIDEVVSRDDLAHQRLVVALEHDERVAQRLHDDVTHAQDLPEGLAQRDRRRVQHLRVEIDRPALGAPGLGDEPREHVRRETGEGKEDQREDDVEDRVRVGDLALHVGRRGADEITERADERKEDGDPDELERDVRRGDAARFGVLTDRRERGGHGGPNVRAEDHRDGTLERHETGGRERQGETDHRGARPHQPGEDRRKQDEEQRLRGEGAQEIGEERALGERSGPVAHELHPEEEESEAQNGLPDVAPGSATGHEQEPSEEHDERGHLEQVEREKLHGHRGPDVRAEDHPDRLPQREQSRRREADKHHRGRARRLEDRGDAGADEERADTIAGERREDVPKTRARGALEALADEVDPVEEERGTAEEREEDQVCLAHVVARLAG